MTESDKRRNPYVIDNVISPNIKQNKKEAGRRTNLGNGSWAWINNPMPRTRACYDW